MLAVKVLCCVNGIIIAIADLFISYLYILLNISFHLPKLSILIRAINPFYRVINTQVFWDIPSQHKYSILLRHNKFSTPGASLTWVRVNIRIKVIAGTSQPVKSESDQTLI